MTRRHRTLSHHMLRRTARKRLHQFRSEQALAAAGLTSARRKLRELGIDELSDLRVESSRRGPFGWRVIELEGRQCN